MAESLRAFKLPDSLAAHVAMLKVKGNLKLIKLSLAQGTLDRVGILL